MFCFFFKYFVLFQQDNGFQVATFPSFPRAVALLLIAFVFVAGAGPPCCSSCPSGVFAAVTQQ